MLGIDLREHFKSVRGPVKSLSPAAQAAFLHVLQHPEKGALSPQEMAGTLGYASMSMSRAFDELESAGLGRGSTAGKRRLMELPGAKGDLWERALPLLRSPVAESMRIPRDLWTDRQRGSVPWRITPASLNRACPSSSFCRHVAAESNKLVHEQTGGANAPLVEVEAWTYPPKAVSDGPWLTASRSSFAQRHHG